MQAGPRPAVARRPAAWPAAAGSRQPPPVRGGTRGLRLPNSSFPPVFFLFDTNLLFGIATPPSKINDSNSSFNMSKTIRNSTEISRISHHTSSDLQTSQAHLFLLVASIIRGLFRSKFPELRRSVPPRASLRVKCQ